MPKKTIKSIKTSKKSKTVKKVVTKSPKKSTKKTKKTAQVAPPVAPPVVAPLVHAAPPAPPVKTEADKIWEEIQNLPLNMFGLPGQTVSMHCTFVKVEPSALYLVSRSSATLPSLEAAVSPAFTVELADKFIIVRRAPKPVVPSKK